MKVTNIKLMLTLVLIFIAIILTITYVGTAINEVSALNVQLKSETTLYDENFQYKLSTDITTPDEYKAAINDVLSLMPKNVAYELSARCNIIILCDDTMNEYIEKYNDIIHADLNEKTAGFVLSTDDVIIIREEIHYDIFVAVLSHEYGHAYDFMNGDVSKNKDFSELYNQYSKTYHSLNYYVDDNYITQNSKEWFAAIFSDYLYNSNHMSEQYPEIFEYIDTLLNKSRIA